jgi:hypothetical protein
LTQRQKDKKVEDILRVIELCRSVRLSSADPFEVDIMEKIQILRKLLPDYRFLDELLLDAEALYQLSQIVKLQDEYIKRKASSMYIDPLLIELKLRLLSKESLASALTRSLHPIAKLDQISPKGLERAFIYWRDLQPLSERFKEDKGVLSLPGKIDIDGLISMKIFSKEKFEDRLKTIEGELKEKSKGGWVDYNSFIKAKDYVEKVERAYILAFLITEGKAEIRIDTLSEKIYLRSLEKKTTGQPSSFAIPVGAE